MRDMRGRTARSTVGVPLGIGLLLTVVAALPRVVGLRTDFWFDEILSYQRFALRARSIADIFVGSGFKDDNNHPLNTIVLYLLRDAPGWTVYRLPAFAAGILTVLVATAIARRRTAADSVISGLVVAASFLMVVYSTEARGYAFLLLFALLAYRALGRYLAAPSLRDAAFFWLWFALGLMAHLEIVHMYTGALLWSGFRLRDRRPDLVRLHAVPVLTAIVWGLVVVRGSVVGGGPPWTWRQITDQSLAWTVGYPLSTIPAGLALAAAVALVVWDARQFWTEGSDEGLFFVGAVLGAPILISALDPPFLFPRYFLISALFFLLVIARVLARLWRSGSARRVLAAATLCAVLAGNLAHLRLFARDGRGHLAEAVEDMVNRTPDHPAVVSTRSLDQWSELPILFYERKLQLGDAIV